eukprot:364919-Chlamydomonas_euryale.AAC.5
MRVAGGHGGRRLLVRRRKSAAGVQPMKRSKTQSRAGCKTTVETGSPPQRRPQRLNSARRADAAVHASQRTKQPTACRRARCRGQGNVAGASERCAAQSRGFAKLLS